MERKFQVVVEPPLLDVNDQMIKETGIIPSVPLKEFFIPVGSPVFPKFTKDYDIEGERFIWLTGVVVNLPHKVTIKIDSANLESFSWRKVGIPVAIRIRVSKSVTAKGLSMSFQDKSNDRHIKTVPVVPEAWAHSRDVDDPEFNGPESLYNKVGRHGDGGWADYWNMTYFIDLPKCSMSYDFWVTARGMDSEKKLFEIDFYVDDQKITQANLKKMSEKFPSLK